MTAGSVDWSTLASTTLGGLLALVGGLLGQWWGESRAVAREQRDRDHERRVWARAQQLDAYAEFFSVFERRFDEVGLGRETDTRADTPFADLDAALSTVRLFGSEAARGMADAMFFSLLAYGNPRNDRKEAAQITVDDMENFRQQVRADLGLPD